MTITDQKTIVKRIAKAWKESNDMFIKYPNATHSALMLAYRYSLEQSGLTINEIIALGNATDLDLAIDNLFSQTQK